MHNSWTNWFDYYPCLNTATMNQGPLADKGIDQLRELNFLDALHFLLHNFFTVSPQSLPPQSVPQQHFLPAPCYECIYVKLATAKNSYKTNSNAVKMLAERHLVTKIKIYVNNYTLLYNIKANYLTRLIETITIFINF